MVVRERERGGGLELGLVVSIITLFTIILDPITTKGKLTVVAVILLVVAIITLFSIIFDTIITERSLAVSTVTQKR